MQRDISAEQHERVRLDRRVDQGVQVSDGVARSVKEVEAAVAEIVDRAHTTDDQIGLVEVELMHIAARKGGREDRGVWARRPARSEGGFSTGADDEGRCYQEGGRVACVVPVCVAE